MEYDNSGTIYSVMGSTPLGSAEWVQFKMMQDGNDLNIQNSFTSSASSTKETWLNSDY